MSNLNPFNALRMENENENVSSTGNYSRNVVVNKINIENYDRLDNYYLNNYIITQKEWFNELVGDRIKHAIKYYILVQIYRLLSKILKYHQNIYLTKNYPQQVGNLLEVQRKINHFENYLNLNINKINVIYSVIYKDYFENYNENNEFQFKLLTEIYEKIMEYVFDMTFKKKRNTQQKYDNFFSELQKKIDFNQKKYKTMIDYLLTPIEKRQIGLLEWIFNTELSLIELIVHKNIFKQKGSNIKNRNHNKALTNYANYQSQNISKENYLKNRTKIERIKFDNFNLFTEIKKKHLKSNECFFQFEKRGENNSFVLPAEFNNESFDKFFDNLEIENFSFLKRIRNNGNAEFANKIFGALKKLTNLYLVPVDEEDSKILRTSRDIILMSIAYIFYYDNFNININNGNQTGKGAYGIVKIKGNKVLKFENLRMIAKDKELKEEIIRSSRPYIKQSYVSAIQFISFIIQKYLYNLQPKNINNKFTNFYVPNIFDIRFDYINGISELNMESSLNKQKNNYKYSIDFKKLLFDEDNLFYKKANFEIFVLNIFKKLCEILLFYQNKCCFIHRDLNGGNFMINFNIKEDNNFDIENFEIKLVDFMLSSIILNNSLNKKSILIYINYNPSRNFEISNPYINKDWRLLDTKYIINAILLAYTLNEKLDFLRKIIKNIFYPSSNNNYLNRLKNIKIKCTKHVAFESYYYKDIFDTIYSKNFNYELFNPERLIEKINRELNKY